jgi:hypothetical protein
MFIDVMKLICWSKDFALVNEIYANVLQNLEKKRQLKGINTHL